MKNIKNLPKTGTFPSLAPIKSRNPSTIMGNGKMGIDRAKASKDGLMDLNMTDIGRIIKPMEKEGLSTLMVMSMRVIG